MNAPDRLAAKVRAVNRAHQIAREIYPRLLEAMRPFIGSKVYTVNGALLAKVEKALPDLPHENGPGGGVMVYRYTSTYSLVWIVKVHQTDSQGIAHYAEASVYVGETDGGALLKRECQATDYRTDYTETEIRAKQAALIDAQKALREAQSALFPFEERD